jgi:hypothetical protein
MSAGSGRMAPVASTRGFRSFIRALGGTNGGATLLCALLRHLEEQNFFVDRLATTVWSHSSHAPMWVPCLLVTARVRWLVKVSAP